MTTPFATAAMAATAATAATAAAASRRTPTEPPRGRAGFTVIEVIVAILLLTIGVLSLAATAAVVEKQMARGSRQTVASTIAQARFDSLASLQCSRLAQNGATTAGTYSRPNGEISEAWQVTDSNDVKFVQDRVFVYGLKDTLLYTTFIPCRDN